MGYHTGMEHMYLLTVKRLVQNLNMEKPDQLFLRITQAKKPKLRLLFPVLT